MLFTTNKSPLTAWGAVLHDADLAEAIVDRILERGRLMLLDGPSYRTQHLDLDLEGAELAHDEPARISGKHRPEFPEPTTRRYERPQTPYERVLACSEVSEATKQRLHEQFAAIDPIALNDQIVRLQRRLLRLAAERATPMAQAG